MLISTCPTMSYIVGVNKYIILLYPPYEYVIKGYLVKLSPNILYNSFINVKNNVRSTLLLLSEFAVN